MLDLKTWETVVKSPVHFNKEKSGIMLEVLALQKLDTGINNHNLAAAANTLAMAFTETYKASDGSIINKFNFRLHDLLLQTITLNDSIPSFQKWERFQSTTGKIYYNEADRLPKRMKWLMTEQDFNKQVNYILDNKTKYEERLKQRAENFKL
ncbi:MAG: hypothetical protein ABUT20_30450 [Bacteroidota bacterium]